MPAALDTPFSLATLRRRLKRAAEGGVLVGTTSWKYREWLGVVYDEQRYLRRGKVAVTRFERECLEEYAEIFPTVCVDASYYRFPERDKLEEMAERVTPGFLFTLKVTDEITVRRFPRLPRFGTRGGHLNAHFLDTELFLKAFLEPCAAIRENIGMLVFEFSKFHRDDFLRGRDFVTALGRFLETLPAGWNYGVEVRNHSFLHPDYFAMLRERGVTHVFNSWTDMTPVSEQRALPGSETTPDKSAARFMLTPGWTYERSEELFQSANTVLAVNAEARKAGGDMIRDGMARGGEGRRTFIYVNNWLEGFAPHTIDAMLAEGLDGE